jgi:hypothetical protein
MRRSLGPNYRARFRSRRRAPNPLSRRADPTGDLAVHGLLPSRDDPQAQRPSLKMDRQVAEGPEASNRAGPALAEGGAFRLDRDRVHQPDASDPRRDRSRENSVKNLEVVTQMRYTTYGAGFPDAPATLEQGLRRTRVLWVSDPQVFLFPGQARVKQLARTCREVHGRCHQATGRRVPYVRESAIFDALGPQSPGAAGGGSRSSAAFSNSSA